MSVVIFTFTSSEMPVLPVVFITIEFLWRDTVAKSVSGTNSTFVAFPPAKYPKLVPSPNVLLLKTTFGSERTFARFVSYI